MLWGVVPGVPPRAFAGCPFGARDRHAEDDSEISLGRGFMKLETENLGLFWLWIRLGG